MHAARCYRLFKLCESEMGGLGCLQTKKELVEIKTLLLFYTYTLAADGFWIVVALLATESGHTTHTLTQPPPENWLVIKNNVGSGLRFVHTFYRYIYIDIA